MALVKFQGTDPGEMASVRTTEFVDDLGLKPGDAARSAFSSRVTGIRCLTPCLHGPISAGSRARLLSAVSPRPQDVVQRSSAATKKGLRR